jgi:UPF0716 protein FxsA
MPAVIAVILLITPLAELAVIIKVATYIGLPETLLLLVGVSIAGAFLLKREGMATWRRLRGTLGRGEMPTTEVTDGALILLGGALLLTPGFITDVIGLLMLIPGPRAIVKRWFRRAFGLAAMRSPAARLGIYSSRVVRATSRGDRNAPGSAGTSTESTTTSGPTELPPGAARRDEGGSRDRG